jgi:hypothetical protein
MDLKKSAPYECYTQTTEERDCLLELVKRIVSDDIDGLVNEFV